MTGTSPSAWRRALLPAPTAWVVDELTLIGSRGGPFPAALALVADGVVDPRPLITARVPLDRADEGLRAGGMKVVVDAAEV